MANILGIFTAIILGVAAFVAMKNKAHFTSEIETRDTEKASLATSQDRLKAAQKVLKDLPIETAGIDEEAAAKTEEETALKESNDALKAGISSKVSTIASNKTKLDEIREKTAKIGDLQNLASKMKSMGAELEEMTQSIADNEASLSSLTDQNTVTEADATKRKKEFEDMSKGESLATLKTRIRSIYPAWGFVTLSDGNNAGVVANSTLDIVRDGETVAKLLVTSVESSSASASIVPDSIGENVTLMVGDRVVPGKKASAKKAAGN